MTATSKPEDHRDNLGIGVRARVHSTANDEAESRLDFGHPKSQQQQQQQLFSNNGQKTQNNDEEEEEKENDEQGERTAVGNNEPLVLVGVQPSGTTKCSYLITLIIRNLISTKLNRLTVTLDENDVRV